VAFSTALKSLIPLILEAESPDQDPPLAELAANTGRSAVEVAQEAITRFLDDETRFAEAVKLGIAAAARGDFVSAEKVWEDAERILQS
jgi:predicted transcriptional regulator